MKSEDDVRAEERKRIGKLFEGLYALLEDFEWNEEKIKLMLLPRLRERIDLLKQGKEIK